MRTQQEMVVVGAVQPIVEKYIVAEPLEGERAEFVYEGVNKLIKAHSKAPAFKGHWNLTRDGIIEGSSPFHLVLANSPEVLGSLGLRTLTYEEARMLESQDRLTTGVYRDFEILGYNPGDPNSDIAEILLGSNPEIEFPFKAHPRDLRITGRNTRYGVGISFIDNPLLTTTGKEVDKAANSLKIRGNSGVHRLGHNCYHWIGEWRNLADSHADGRVDWVCREVTRAEIEALNVQVINRVYNDAIRDAQSRRERALQVLRGK